jgi:hypothetical protein
MLRQKLAADFPTLVRQEKGFKKLILAMPKENLESYIGKQANGPDGDGMEYGVNDIKPISLTIVLRSNKVKCLSPASHFSLAYYL